MFEKILEKLAKLFEEKKIPYMIIGGQAVLMHGEARMTQDIDITLGLGPEDLEKVLHLCQEAHWQVLVANPYDFVTKTMVLPCQDQQTGIRLDLVFSFSPYEKEALKRAQSFTMGGSKLKVASVEDLMIHKIIAGRPRDLEDLRMLCLKHPKLDKTYIKHWLDQYAQVMEQALWQQFEAILEDT
ncbi:MAG: nucleotidyltransferase [Deltaproteobacteria bacterium]|nr:nucleotidyltransferase [Deltaproteobacteria bacterium]